MNVDSPEDKILAALRLATTGPAEPAGAAPAQPGTDVAQQLAQLALQLGQLREASAAQTNVVGQNTATLSQNTATQSTSGGKSAISTIGDVVSTVLSGRLGLSPLIGGILSLFGGDKNKELPPLSTHVDAPRIDYSLGFSRSAGGELQELSYGSGGLPRLVETLAGRSSSDQDQPSAAPAGAPESEGAAGWWSPLSTDLSPALPSLRYSGTARAAARRDWPEDSDPPTAEQASLWPSVSGRLDQRFAPQITIQVQAMDSQSFLDHSDEIAGAVREAMLNSHSLNSLIADM